MLLLFGGCPRQANVYVDIASSLGVLSRESRARRGAGRSSRILPALRACRPETATAGSEGSDAVDVRSVAARPSRWAAALAEPSAGPHARWTQRRFGSTV